MDVIVSLDQRTNGETLRRVQALLDAEGVSASVDARLGGKSIDAGAVDIVILVIIADFLRTFAKSFAQRSGELAAEESVAALKRLVEGLSRAVEEDESVKEVRTVSMRDRDTSTMVVLKPGLPDSAYEGLTDIDWERLRDPGGWLTWDARAEDWRDAHGRNLPRITN